MEGSLAGRPSTFLMHASSELAIPLLVIYCTDVQVCLEVCTRMVPTGLLIK